MNITNTMCRLEDLTQEQIDSLVEIMPRGPYFDFDDEEKLIGFTESDAGTWESQDEFEIVTYAEMMRLIGKTMEFTKSDLKAGVHFVKVEAGVYYAVLGEVISSIEGFLSLDKYSDNLKRKASCTIHYDIVAVYVPSCRTSLNYYLKGQHLTKVWERTEQTPAQKEMQELLSNIEKAEKSMVEMKEQAKVLQAKL
jgi:hypothetical protein